MPLPIIAPLPLVMPLSMKLPLVSLVHLVVELPFLTPPPPICQKVHLSLCCHLLLHHCLSCLLSGWLMHCLSSPRRLPSAGASTSHCCCMAPPHVVPLPLVPLLLGLLSGWLLHYLSSRCRLLPAGASASHHHANASHASSLASWHIASPPTATSYLLAPPPLITLSALVMPLSGILSG